MSEKTGLTQRIAAFYRRNPEEWLSYDDMALKFGCTKAQAQAACTYLTERHGIPRETMHIVRLVIDPAKDRT